MSKYPDIDDDNFYQFINKKFAKYKIPKKQKTFKEICFPKKFELQIPQKFLAEFINPQTPYRGLLVYYQIGSGKTLASINIAENFKKIKNIMVVVPAFLKGNFRSELRSPATGNKYLTNNERELLKKLYPAEPLYKQIIKKSDARIDKYYNILSYNKFVDLIRKKKIKLTNTLLIIDEVHNMISETGIYYEILYKTIDQAPNDLRLILMSATPIFDKPIEIPLTMNLLLKDKKMPIGQEFVDTFITTKYTSKGIIYTAKNLDLFKNYVRGYISYFKGAPSYTFPRTELNFVRCRMSETQEKLYQKVIAKELGKYKGDELTADISNSFFIGTRMISNFVYPNKQIGRKGYNSLEDDDFSIANIKEFSPKFLKILRKIKKSEGTVFVYSSFKNYGGLKPFIRLLEHHHFKNYAIHGQGLKRFAIWSGDETLPYKEEIKAVFNNKNNEDGSKIKIILASPAAREGVSFLRIEQVHIMEPYWNMSRLMQIMGRAIRFCSHKDLPSDKRLVKVYIYLATHPNVGKSIDEKIMKMALQKQYISSVFEKAMKEAAIDCELFYNANVDPKDEEKLVCEK